MNKFIVRVPRCLVLAANWVARRAPSGFHADWTGSVPVAEGGVKRDFMLRRCYVWDSDMLRQMSSPVLAS